MRKKSVAFELTDGEIRAFWFSIPPFRKSVDSSATVKFDRIPIPVGVIEQGNVRDENVLINILATYRAQHLGENQKVYLAIHLQQGFIRSYTLPWISKRDRKSAISLLVDEEISIARSDLLYDFLVLSEKRPDSLQILLGATRQSLLARYVFIFGQAGFKVLGIDFAFSILGQSLGFEPDEDVLYLQEESGSFRTVLFRGAVPESVRSVVAGGSANELTEELGNEIRRFLLYHRTQHPDFDLKRLVWDGDSGAELLGQGLLASSHVPALERAEIKSVPDSWRRALKENKSPGEVVVGYALRIATHRPGLNLLSQPNAVQRLKQRYCGLAFFNLILLMLGTIIWFLLYQMTLPMQQEVVELSRQGARIKVQVNRQQDLEAAWNKVQIHTEKIGKRLAQVQALKGTGVKVEQVIYKQGNMSLTGSANDSRSIQTLIPTLRSMGWLQPALSSYKLTPQNNVEFSLSAKNGRVLGGEDK